MTDEQDYEPLDAAVLELVAKRHPDEYAAFRVAVAAKRDDAFTHPWERCTEYELRRDGHITFAAIARARRLFEAAGWETRLVSEPTEPDTLRLDVRARAGFPRPTFTDASTPLTPEAALGSYREADGLTDDGDGQNGQADGSREVA